jgi:hypothetical protein
MGVGLRSNLGLGNFFRYLVSVFILFLSGLDGALGWMFGGREGYDIMSLSDGLGVGLTWLR